MKSITLSTHLLLSTLALGGLVLLAGCGGSSDDGASVASAPDAPPAPAPGEMPGEADAASYGGEAMDDYGEGYGAEAPGEIDAAGYGMADAGYGAGMMDNYGAGYGAPGDEGMGMAGYGGGMMAGGNAEYASAIQFIRQNCTGCHGDRKSVV